MHGTDSTGGNSARSPLYMRAGWTADTLTLERERERREALMHGTGNTGGSTITSVHAGWVDRRHSDAGEREKRGGEFGW